MRREELKSGQIVKFENESYGVMLGSTAVVFTKGSSGGISQNLMSEKCISKGIHPIVEVYDVIFESRLNAGFEFWANHIERLIDNCTLVWEKPVLVEELTLEQVIKELGREIKIVKG